MCKSLMALRSYWHMLEQEGTGVKWAPLEQGTPLKILLLLLSLFTSTTTHFSEVFPDYTNQ